MQKTHQAENKKSILVVDDDLSTCQTYEYFFDSAMRLALLKLFHRREKLPDHQKTFRYLD